MPLANLKLIIKDLWATFLVSGVNDILKIDYIFLTDQKTLLRAFKNLG